MVIFLSQTESTPKHLGGGALVITINYKWYLSHWDASYISGTGVAETWCWKPNSLVSARQGNGSHCEDCKAGPQRDVPSLRDLTKREYWMACKIARSQCPWILPLGIFFYFNLKIIRFSAGPCTLDKVSVRWPDDGWKDRKTEINMPTFKMMYCSAQAEKIKILSQTRCIWSMKWHTIQHVPLVIVSKTQRT